MATQPAAEASTHRAKVLAWLKRGRHLTPMQALEKIGTFRLAARVHELRKDGWQIETDMSEGYASYFMLTKKRAA